ncbi:leucine-rich repeat protein [Histomonas meleagridis]|uniref:leucine-rich repeat protein n=1 Tax=Histomonas meleagridis TaxID=135588 RepID=UPI003559870C|nr:leucine-rich repeat protein [Histomonas meleagridis]
MIIFASIILPTHANAVINLNYTTEYLWSTDILGSEKIEDLLILNYTNDRYDEVLELLIRATVSWRFTVPFTLVMTREEHHKITGLPVDVELNGIGDFWEQYLAKAYYDVIKYARQIDIPYASYLNASINGLTTYVQWLNENHDLNPYKGYITVILKSTSHFLTSQDEERRSRQEVDNMFATGNFTGYGPENDLHTDYEKLVAIWWWINDNVVYGQVPQYGNSVYSALFQHRTVCRGYSALSTLFFNRAGVEGFTVLGVTTSAHAWNWVHLGEDWYAYDSTTSLEAVFLRGINAEYHRTHYTYDDGELDWGYPITDVDYKYKMYTWHEPKDKPLLYQMEATDSGLIGSNLRWTLKNGLLTIKGNGPMRDFESEALVPWKNFFDDITDLKIEEGVTTIGAYAFYNVEKLTYEKCKDKLGSIQLIGKKAFSDLDKFFQDFKVEASSKINNLKFLGEENKAKYTTQISNAKSHEELNEIVVKAQTESNKNEETQKTLAKNKIDDFKFLEEENKVNYTTQISNANSQEELNEIVSTAESSSNKNEETQKTLAKNKINDLKFLEEENKVNYAEKISNANSLEELNEIVVKAQTESNKNEETQKTLAKNKINDFKFLEEENKVNYTTQISNANSQEELNEIVSTGESASNKNEETQKTLAKNKINDFKFLEEENKANYTTQVSNANSLEELNEIVAKAQSQNEEIKSNKKESVKQDIGKLENLGELQQEYIDKLNNAQTEQEFNQILQEAIAKNEEMKSNGNDSKGNTNTAVAVAVPVAIVVVVVVVIVIVLVVRRKKNNAHNKIIESSEKSSEV